MSAADLAAVLVSIAAIGAFVVLIVTVQSLLRTLHEVRATLDRIRVDAVPLVAEMRDAVSSAGAEVERVDELIDAAASIQQTVDHASRLTYLAFSNPLIKLVAFFRGLGRGVGRAFGAGGRRRRRVESRRQQRENKRAA
jgi:hypothetical protein